MNKQDFFDEINLRIKQIQECMNVYKDCDFDVKLDWKKTKDDLFNMYFSNDEVTPEDKAKFLKKLARSEPSKDNHNRDNHNAWTKTYCLLERLYTNRARKTPEDCQEFLENLMQLKPKEDSHE